MKKLLIISSLFLSLHSYAYAKNEIDVYNATIKALPPGAKVTAMYLKVKNNTKKPITLERINGKFAENFEIHDMKTENGVMKMIKLNNVLIEENSELILKKGGKHIMVFDPLKPIIPGHKYGIELVFTNGKKVYAEAHGIDITTGK